MKVSLMILWDHQGIFTQRTATHWIFSLFLTILCESKKLFCIKITVLRKALLTSKTMQCSKPLKSPLYPLTLLYVQTISTLLLLHRLYSFLALSVLFTPNENFCIFNFATSSLASCLFLCHYLQTTHYNRSHNL